MAKNTKESSMRFKLIISVGLSVLALCGCKNSTSSKNDLVAEDLLGRWTFTHQLFNITLTTNVTANIVDSWSIGTGYLTVSKTNDPLNFVHISNYDYDYGPDRINTVYNNISIRTIPGIFLSPGEDYWAYSANQDWDNVYGYLSHSWTGETMNMESWYSQSPHFTFSEDDFTFSVEDTLTKFDYETSTWDSAYVSGSVTAATTYLQANRPTQFMEYELFPENSHFMTFSADSSFVEEYTSRDGFTDEGTWFLQGGLLHLIYNWTDADSVVHPDEYVFSVNISGEHMSLETSGDACDDSDPAYPMSDCFTSIAHDFWPLEGSDISAATAGNYNELEKSDQPALSMALPGDIGIPLSKTRSHFRRGT